MKKPTTKQAYAIGLIALFIGFFLWGRVAEAAEARLGVGWAYQNTAGATYQELMVTSSDLRWYGAATRIGGDDRHNYEYWRVTAGYRVNWRSATNFNPYMRLGVAYFDEEPTDYISDQFAFDMAAGLRLYNLVELEIEHNSTAGRSSQNEGLDAVTLSVVLPFGRD